MSNFKIGQKVVCIYTFEDDGETIDPVKGEMYTIREIDNLGGLLFEEIINIIRYYSEGPAERSFHPCRFRPLDHAFADKVEAMIKEQVKKQELVNI
jgi:hypothetical protein